MNQLRLNQAIAGLLCMALPAICPTTPAEAQVAVRGKTVYTMAGPPIKDGVVLINNGKITAIGKAGDINIPKSYRVVAGAIVTPGLVDAHSTVGVSGILNYDHDQEQLERSEPLQPELRAIDAYNTHEELITWIRKFGVTTVHTGHAPGELMSGQTLVAKTIGNTIDDAVLIRSRAVAATLASSAQKSGGKSPGTRGKMIAMLRAALIEAQEYKTGRQHADQSKRPARNLRLETLARILDRKLPLMVTADRAQDIASALRLAREFKLKLWLDSAAEAYLLIDEIKAAKVPVIIHPTMARATGERENLSFETAARLVKAGIPVVMQSGYEPYVPKTRVVLFEAALGAAHGLSFEQALRTITIDAARLLGVDRRVGSLQVGKDGDVAVYDGDPFEYTSHCVGVVINGKVVVEQGH